MSVKKEGIDYSSWDALEKSIRRKGKPVFEDVESDEERIERLEREAIQDDGRTYDDWKAEAEAPSDEPSEPTTSKPTITIDDAEDDAEDEQTTEQDAYKQASSSPNLLPLFPISVLEIPIFYNYTEAHKNKTEAPMEYHVGILKGLLGASLGRRIYIAENRPIYPNSYIALIGRSGRARKSHAMGIGFDLLDRSDANVIYTKSINSSEGLGNVFGLPHGCKLGVSLVKEDEETGEEILEPVRGGVANFVSDMEELDDKIRETSEKEGFRVIAYLDELSHVLLKSRNKATANLPQILQQLYDMPKSVDRLTKTDTQRSPYPCFSMVCASTIEQFHQSMDAANIHGGLANRLEYYIVDQLGKKAFSEESDRALLDAVMIELHNLRGAFNVGTAFKYSDDAIAYGEAIYDKQTDANDAESNPYVRDALSRWDLQMKKSSLIFSALRVAKSGEDCIIEKDDIERAYDLQRYLIGCAKFLYEQFTETAMGDVEERVLKAIDRGLHLASEIKGATRLDYEVVFKALDNLVKAGVLIPDDSKGTKTRYYRA